MNNDRERKRKSYIPIESLNTSEAKRRRKAVNERVKNTMIRRNALKDYRI